MKQCGATGKFFRRSNSNPIRTGSLILESDYGRCRFSNGPDLLNRENVPTHQYGVHGNSSIHFDTHAGDDPDEDADCYNQKHKVSGDAESPYTGCDYESRAPGLVEFECSG